MIPKGLSFCHLNLIFLKSSKCIVFLWVHKNTTAPLFSQFNKIFSNPNTYSIA